MHQYSLYRLQIEKTVEKWLELGTIDNIVASLTSSPDLSYQALKLIELVVFRLRSEDSSRTWLIERLKSEGGVGSAVSDAVCLFSDARLLGLSESILRMFAGE